ncbi:MAG: hypothetical protein LBS68_02750 [Puniceicoccales bacterium]|nr:hypothetical protein [Puniceicoccales bacterium]
MVHRLADICPFSISFEGAVDCDSALGICFSTTAGAEVSPLDPPWSVAGRGGGAACRGRAADAPSPLAVAVFAIVSKKLD